MNQDIEVKSLNLKKSYIIGLLVAALLLGAVGSFVGVQLAQQTTESNSTASSEGQRFSDLPTEQQQEFLNSLQGSTDSEDLEKVSQAIDLIQNQYLEQVDKDQLLEGAIQGMLKTLEDPYSVYMDKETVEEFNHQIESSFEGIGAEVSMVEGKVTIVAPIKDSPAEKAGLKPNDQILKVDDQSVEGYELYEAVSLIRGEEGTKVTIEVERPGVDEPFDVELTRDDIPLETVYSEIQEIDGQKAGIIEITSFSEDTESRFKEELTRLEQEENIDGLVIDVRGNPGGLLPSIQEILKNFITKDQPYMQIADGDDQTSRYFSELDQPKDYPISVLIDEGSASASEILAVSMKEAGGYDIVGTPSFGKGTVQQTIPMGDGSTIKLTMFKWLSPEGNWIHEEGVQPTHEVKQPDYFYANPIQIEEPLTLNENNDKIENAQIMLKGLGYDAGREDGYYDEQTEEVVSKFQQDNDLTVTGEINTDTAELLQTKIVEIIQAGENDVQKQRAVEVLFE
ncbi:S41 family peptidase [Aquibacillus sediminis]|uniref:S41 family peptidase n=1 Tax=Aquibacillus sediminis TaxID=2574734 RepID=UPI001FE92C3C|nr:S41 family peptidase [Aquibacillus sediminis]